MFLKLVEMVKSTKKYFPTILISILLLSKNSDLTSMTSLALGGQNRIPQIEEYEDLSPWYCYLVSF